MIYLVRRRWFVPSGSSQGCKEDLLGLSFSFARTLNFWTLTSTRIPYGVQVISSRYGTLVLSQIRHSCLFKSFCPTGYQILRFGSLAPALKWTLVRSSSHVDLPTVDHPFSGLSFLVCELYLLIGYVIVIVGTLVQGGKLSTSSLIFCLVI